MKQSTSSPQENKPGNGRSFWRWVLAFLIVMIIIYLYFMLADLSTAPKFIYSEF